MRILFFVAGLTLLPSLTHAETYTVLYDQSEITFAAEHAGKPFEGVFQEWHADINFDRENLGDTSATIIIDLSSATTGSKLYDGTLPEADWFDTDKHPQATYSLASVQKTENGYMATGNLTLKGMTKPVLFDFTMEGDSPVTMQAEFPINRHEFNIGEESDPNAEWVSEEIMVNLNIVAKKN